MRLLTGNIYAVLVCLAQIATAPHISAMQPRRAVPEPPKAQKYDDLDTFESQIQPLVDLGGETWRLDNLLHDMALTKANVDRLRAWHDIIQMQAQYKDEHNNIAQLAQQLDNITEIASHLVAYQDSVETLQKEIEDPLTEELIYSEWRSYLVENGLDPIDAAEMTQYMRDLGTMYVPYEGFTDEAAQLVMSMKSVNELPKTAHEFQEAYQSYIFETAVSAFTQIFLQKLAQRKGSEKKQRLGRITPETHTIASRLPSRVVYDAVQHGLESGAKKLAALETSRGTMSPDRAPAHVSAELRWLQRRVPNALDTIATQFGVMDTYTMQRARQIVKDIEYLVSIYDQSISSVLSALAGEVNQFVRHPYQALNRHIYPVHPYKTPSAPDIETMSIENIRQALDNFRNSSVWQSETARKTYIFKPTTISDFQELIKWQELLERAKTFLREQLSEEDATASQLKEDIDAYLDHISILFETWEDNLLYIRLDEIPSAPSIPDKYDEAIDALIQISVSLTVDMLAQSKFNTNISWPNSLEDRLQGVYAEEERTRITQWNRYLSMLQEAVQANNPDIEETSMKKLNQYQEEISRAVKKYGEKRGTMQEVISAKNLFFEMPIPPAGNHIGNMQSWQELLIKMHFSYASQHLANSQLPIDTRPQFRLLYLIPEQTAHQKIVTWRDYLDLINAWYEEKPQRTSKGIALKIQNYIKTLNALIENYELYEQIASDA